LSVKFSWHKRVMAWAKALLACAACAPCLHAVRTAHINVRSEGSASDCNIPAMHCEDVREWLEQQRAMGKCRPMQPRWIRCTAGKVPTTTAWNTWESPSTSRPHGQECEAYFDTKTCLYANEGGSTGKMKAAVGDGPCTGKPKLTVKDCDAMRETLEALVVMHENKTPHEDFGSEIAEDLIDLASRAPKEWIWLPPTRTTVQALADMLAGNLKAIDQLDDSAKAETSRKQNVPIWHALLMYCPAAEARDQVLNEELYSDKAWESQVADVAQRDCFAITRLDKLISKHPWKDALAMNSAGLALDLEGLAALGVHSMSQDVWDELGAVIRHANAKEPLDVQLAPVKIGYPRLQARFKELIETAGDRSESELDWALQLSIFAFADGAKPTGGQQRLDEMRTLRNLKNALSGNNDAALEKAIAAAQQLVKDDSQPQWVDTAEFSEVLRRAQGLENEVPSDTPSGATGTEPTNEVPSGTANDATETEPTNQVDRDRDNGSKDTEPKVDSDKDNGAKQPEPTQSDPMKDTAPAISTDQGNGAPRLHEQSAIWSTLVVLLGLLVW